MSNRAEWPTKRLGIASLHLDPKNPRLGREATARAPSDIIQYLFDNDKALDVARSIAGRGYFANEPLLVVYEDGKYIVVEGNRRLAALKALREPGLLDKKHAKAVERLAKTVSDDLFKRIPVTIAPDRKSTDKLIAGRHIGTPVLAWQAENRASFILDKLAEGYSNDDLRDDLGFSLADIQKARQTRAIAEMARSLDLPDEVRAKIDSPRANILTTIERVIESSAGRAALMVELDAEHGIRGTTTKAQFVKGFRRLVEDVVLGHKTSRSLNTNEQIKAYFKGLPSEDRPERKQGSFVPADLIDKKSVASKKSPPKPSPKKPPTKSALKTVLPKDFKIKHGSERIIDIRDELVRLNRSDFPNAGAVLLRVFFELATVDYLKRTGEMRKITERIERKDGRLPYGVPTMRQLVPEIHKIADKKLGHSDAERVKKAVKYDASAPFTLSELHAFVHQSADLPSDRDILQFWMRTEALLRLMLESDDSEPLA